jgi:hypothetical protein
VAVKPNDLGWNIANPQWMNPEQLDALYEEMRK